MNKAWAFRAYGVAVMILAGCQLNGNDPTNRSSTIPQPDERSLDAGQLSGTVVTPCLEWDMASGKNILWCATFQMAWDELKKMNGGPVRTVPGNQVIDRLNRKNLSPRDIPQAGVLRIAGLVGEGVIEKIQAGLKRIQPNEGRARLIPNRSDWPDDAVILYAYLFRTMRFRTPFSVLGEARFGESKEKTPSESASKETCEKTVFWGIREYSPHSKEEANQARQTRVLWHRFHFQGADIADQEFIVELLTNSSEDRLILAKVEPARTLAGTVNFVLRCMQCPNTKMAENGIVPEMEQQVTDEQTYYRSLSAYSCLLWDESVWIPQIRFDLTKQYAELSGQTIASDDSRLNSKPIMEASQRVRFKLDEKGAEIESEASGVFFCEIVGRDFSFTKPFLILLMRRDALHPYLALWIANRELLVPARKDVKGQSM